jgi:hypothetical protein
MKFTGIAVVALLFAWQPGFASAQSSDSKSVTLGASPESSSTSCVEVQIGNEHAPTLDCLNQRLKAEVSRVQPAMNIPPVDATSPAVKVGGFNQTAMSQQFGQNWGKSVIPFRPAAPVYATPFGH